jgi:hypothetical protein
MPDSTFRTLCADLLQLEQEQPAEYTDWKKRWNAAVARARTALSQPEPVAPTASDVTELSPVAQAVKDAAYTLPIGSGLRSRIAAALRAAAGCVPKGDWGGENYATGFRDGIAFSCQFLHELAAELDNTNNTIEGDYE